MPRSVNPGDIRVGKGRAPEGTVEDNSLRNPDRDVLPLNAHIHDPSRAHFAVSIAIEDVAHNFSSDEVEGALAELAGSTSAGRVNGLLTGGGFSSAGLTFTLNTPTTVLLNGTEQDFGGDSVVLVDNATQFVFIDVSSGTLVTSPTPPSLASEDILLHEVTTLAGSVTGSRDGRWFVFNLDRKPPLTVRSSGTAFNQTSEANFVSLEAALLYLEQYAGTGSDPMETHRIIVRGSHSIPSTYTIPVSGVIFEGDGDASFVDATGGSDLFDLGSQERVQFRDIAFVCNNAATRALYSAGTPNHLTVENCRFVDSGAPFAYAVRLQSASLTSRVRMVNCTVEAASGVFIGRALDTVIEDCSFIGQGGSANCLDLSPGTAGSGDGRTVIRGCRFDNYGQGILEYAPRATVTDCVLTQVNTAVEVQGVSSQVRNVDATLDATSGVVGITVLGANSRVSDCNIENPRAAGSYGAGTDPVGVAVVANDVSITDCRFQGFYNSTGNRGYGIWLIGALDNIRISGVRIDTAYHGILSAGGNRLQVRGAIISGTVYGIDTLAADSILSEINLTLDSTLGISGVIARAARCSLTDSRITNPRAAWIVADVPYGVEVLATGAKIESTRILGFDNTSATPSGAAVYVDGAGDNVAVNDCTLSNSYVGVEILAGASAPSITSNVFGAITLAGVRVNDAGVSSSANNALQISGNVFNSCGSDEGIRVERWENITISGNFLDGGSGTTDRGIILIGVDANNGRTINYNISDNTFVGFREDGIYVQAFCRNGTISNNTINNQLAANNDVLARGIFLDGTGVPVAGCVIDGNTVYNCTRGIAIIGQDFGAPLDVPITDITVTGNYVHHIGSTEVASNAFDGQGSMGIAVQYGDRITIAGNTVDRIGLLVNEDGSTYAPTGANLSAQGILAWSVERVNITGNTVTGVVKQGSATARGIAIRERDATPAGENFFDLNIVGNTCENLLGDTLMDAMILLEVDGSLSANIHQVENVVIADNTSRRGSNSIYVTLGEEAVVSGLTISGNTCESPAIAGVNIDCTGVTSVTLTNVAITGNAIRNATVGSIGVNMAISEPVDLITGTVRNVAITGNTIEDGGAGISLLALNVGLNSNSTFDSVSVLGNTIANTSGNAILVNVGGDGNGSVMRTLSINNNTIEDCGGGVEIFCLYLGGGIGVSEIRGLEVNHNQIRSPIGDGIRARLLSQSATIESASFNGNVIRETTSNGIELLSALAGVWEDIQINGNVIYTPQANGIGLGVADGTMDNFQINGNEIITPGSKTTVLSQGIGITLLAGNGETRNWQVNDNIIDDAGTTGIALGGFELVQQATATVNFGTPGGATVGDSVTIGGIPLVGVSPGPALAGQFVIGGTDNATAQNFADAVNNTTLNPGLGAVASATVAGSVVTLRAIPVGTAGNSVTLAENTAGARITISGATFTGGVGGSGDSSVMRRFQVCRNVINTPGQCGMIILTFDGTLVSFSVNENIINRPGASGGGNTSLQGGGILIGAAEDVGPVSFEKLTFIGNRISWNKGDPGNLASAYGIGILGINVDLNDVLISDCQIDESPSSGIFIIMAASLASGNGRITNLDISDCNVKSDASIGSGPHYGIGIYILASGFNLPHTSISIQGCKLRSDPNNILGAAACLFAFPSGSPDGTKFNQILFSDNIVESSDNGFIWSTFVGTGGTWGGTRPIMENIQVTNNTFKSIEYFGTGCIGSAAGAGADDDLRIENVVISNNSFHDCSRDATFGFTTLVLNYARPWVNTRVDHNTFTDCGAVDTNLFAVIDLGLGEGTAASPGDPLLGVQNLSVCGNNIHRSDPTTGPAGIYVRTSTQGGVVSDWKNVKINNNIIEASLNGGILLDMTDATQNVRNIQVNGNQIDQMDSTGSGGGIFVGIGDVQPEGLDVSHNCINRMLASGSPGIWIYCDGGGVRQMTLIGNKVLDADGDGIFLDFSNAAFNSDGVVISGNTVYDCTTGNGFNFQLDGNAWSNVAIMGNTSASNGNAGFRFNFQTGCTFQAFTVLGNVARSNSTSQVEPLGAGTITANSFQCQGNIAQGSGNDWAASGVGSYVTFTGASQTNNSDY
jgi:hypothetical protein